MDQVLALVLPSLSPSPPTPQLPPPWSASLLHIFPPCFGFQVVLAPLAPRALLVSILISHLSSRSIICPIPVPSAKPLVLPAFCLCFDFMSVSPTNIGT
ncbi:hypothetical protein B0H13DRAFT_2342230 [Mycena leptocephala]|nr:hypothetical protein B0H13DRAFT_2342230 [Mycena leptocephala]